MGFSDVPKCYTIDSKWIIDETGITLNFKIAGLVVYWHKGVTAKHAS